MDSIRSYLDNATPSILPLVDIEQSTHRFSVDLNNQIKRIQSERDKAIIDFKQLNDNIKELTKERKKFIADIEQRNQDIIAYKKEQTNLVESVKKRDQDLKGLTKERKKFITDIEQRNQDIKDLKGIIEQRENDLSILKKRASSLKRSVTIKNKKFEELNSEHLALENTVTSLEENLTTLEDILAQETALSDYKSDQINEILGSRSWRVLSLPRKLSTIWRNKTLYLVKFLGRGGIKSEHKNLTDSSTASKLSTSKSNLLARQDLAASRSKVLNSRWHTALLGAENNLPDKELPNITISAVTFNSEKWLWNFFMSIVNLDYPPHKITLHFVDNGSTDHGVKGIESFITTNKHRYRNMEIFRRPNKGYGVGNDFGIRQSSDDFVLVTNVDTEFYADSLKKAVTVAINDVADVACWEFRQTPYEHPKFYDPITFLTNWTSHACVLMRKEAYLAVGGYDQKIFMYGEDVELSYRFRAYGWKLRYVPSAVLSLIHI